MQRESYSKGVTTLEWLIIPFLYLLSNVIYNSCVQWEWGYQSVYFSLKDLQRYQTRNMSLTDAKVSFDFEWGLKFYPHVFWYFLFICFRNKLELAKLNRQNRRSPKWKSLL